MKSSYLKFLMQSSNAHGIHSPFVYSLVSQCLYSKHLHLSRKEYAEINSTFSYKKTQLIYRILMYFKPTKLLVLGQEAAIATEVLRSTGEMSRLKLWFFTPIAPIPGPIEIAYIADREMASTLTTLEQILPHSGNNTLCIVDNIYATPEMQGAWEAIKEHPRVTVTVDTYELGLAFFRREQTNQHFTVRLSKSRILNALLGLRKLYGLLD